MKSIDPFSGKTIKDCTEDSPAQITRKIEQARQAFAGWRALPLAQRAAHLTAVSRQLTDVKGRYARLITQEMGKPLKEAMEEVEKCARTASYFAENAQTFLADTPLESEFKRSFVTYQPLGVILGIMPWNFPFWQALRFALPTLLAGNAALLKHASNTPGCALAIEELFIAAGLPEHVFQTLLIGSDGVGEVIAHRHVAAVSLTGSTEAGRAVAQQAGKYLKKTVLELGGSDAYVVLHDADLALAVKTCVASRLLNCGQSCISAKRLIVVEAVREAFEQGLVAAFRQQHMGNPLEPGITVGPMARADLRDGLHRQVEQSVAAGARCLLGGAVPEGPGAFYPPTVLTDVKPGMAAYAEELFGPVAVIISARDEEEALRIAGDTAFGLGGAVFTQDLARGERLAREGMESGLCFVNMMVRSDPRFPFGGVKDSGYGRELSAFGIHEFVNIKTVVVA